jgi:RNA polymerase-binding transcription factor DksA
MKINREVERATDPIDQAANNTSLYLDIALNAQKDKLAPETHPDFDGEHCVECGDDMPKARLEMNRVRCMPCQERKERAAKQFTR